MGSSGRNRVREMQVKFVSFSPGFCGKSGEGLSHKGGNCEGSRVERFVGRGRVVIYFSVESWSFIP